ncbi:hypothetical protein [Brevibacillus migulae]|uniref:hypothetical protein n=1 Tax=Brevibacillus migulae TaxID=1644114 RepID=UPI00106DE9A9|nr:hypothetical protein [Brevibacillus migulae]
MVKEVVGGIVSGVICVFGVIIGGFITFKLGMISEKLLIKTNIQIDKIQQTEADLLEIARDMGQLLLHLKRYINHGIDHQKFREANSEIQEKISSIIRRIFKFTGSGEQKKKKNGCHPVGILQIHR